MTMQATACSGAFLHEESKLPNFVGDVGGESTSTGDMERRHWTLQRTLDTGHCSGRSSRLTSDEC